MSALFNNLSFNPFSAIQLYKLWLYRHIRLIGASNSVGNSENYSGKLTRTTARGVLLGIFGGVAPPGFLNPDPVSDKKMSFSTPVFRPGI